GVLHRRRGLSDAQNGGARFRFEARGQPGAGGQLLRQVGTKRLRNHRFRVRTVQRARAGTEPRAGDSPDAPFATHSLGSAPSAASLTPQETPAPLRLPRLDNDSRRVSARACAHFCAPHDECPYMIDRVIELSLRNRFIVVALYIGLAGWGWWALGATPIDAIPDLSDNQVIVFTDWPGHSPQEMEDQVSYPLTVNLQGLAGVRVVRSQSAFGFSMIYVVFDDNVDLYF